MTRIAEFVTCRNFEISSGLPCESVFVDGPNVDGPNVDGPSVDM